MATAVGNNEELNKFFIQSPNVFLYDTIRKNMLYEIISKQRFFKNKNHIF